MIIQLAFISRGLPTRDFAFLSDAPARVLGIVSPRDDLWMWPAAALAVTGLLTAALAWRARLHKLRSKQLQMLVEERTRDLQSAKISAEEARKSAEKSKDLAEAANRAKSEFFSNMSHEIRTPINGVIGMTELALDPSTTEEERQRFLRSSLSSSEALLAIIDDLLDYAKMESGKLALHPAPFNLYDCIENAAETLSVQAADKRIELVCDLDPRVPAHVIGDGPRLRQIVLNLLGNALKFTEKGEVILRVNPDGVGENVVRISVTDTGIGISQDRQKALLSPTLQVDRSSTRRFAGTGLGLAISRRLVELMGGHMQVESELGRGSCFSFAVRLTPTTSSLAKAAANGSNLRGLSVLIVDDNQTNRTILSQMTKHWSMKTTLAENGPEAIALILEMQRGGPKMFDLILTDVLMPEMDGFTMVRAIRNIANLPAFAVVALSSGDFQHDLKSGRELGVDLLLRKPIMRARLHERLQAVFAQTKETALGPFEEPNGLPLVTRSLRILVAEDVLVNQLVVRKILERAGHAVELASDGFETIEKFQLEKFDVIFMDVHMPKLDGFATSRTIRKLEIGKGNRIPIVALTAHAMKGDAEACKAAGMDAYLSKPLRSRDVYAELLALFPSTQTQREVLD